uniref:BTB domain-containing protein n=1 Tax=Eptatretus burgeri TaxID=7764 RepID=A0A8C4QCD7_EPTBU
MGVSASHPQHSISQRARLGSLHGQVHSGLSGLLPQHQGYSLDSKRSVLTSRGAPGKEGRTVRPERKRKTVPPGLATLKQKLSRRRRASRTAHHAKQMRELLSGWPLHEVAALVEEYEAAAALKEVALQACLARSKASSLAQDMACLYEYKYCTDVDLVFQETCFPVHRAILAARCPYFRTRLSLPGTPALGYGAELRLSLGPPGVDLPSFSSLLWFLYTGEFVPEEQPGCGTNGSLLDGDNGVLSWLSAEFGTPNALATDLLVLLESGYYYDAVLCFSSDLEYTYAEMCGGYGPDAVPDELRCHKAILSARCPFFRRLFQRRWRTGEELTERALQAPTRIVLDDSVIPRRYAAALLHCIYTNAVDLTLVTPPASPSTPGALASGPSTLGDAGPAPLPGPCLPSRVEDAMELYAIALFLEFGAMAQGCEDIIAESLSLDSLVATLNWSCQPHGSSWVHRRALHFLCEEFSRVAASPILCSLGQEYLFCALQSDFLQASEQDVLKAVIKWGEYHLIKRMEDREPNLLNSTAHSVSKKGIRRKDLDPEELREMLSPLLPCLRLELLLPANADTLTNALKRGLISHPPSDMLPSDDKKGNAWLRGRQGNVGVKPRLFTPYVEEAKAVLAEQTAVHADKERHRWARVSSIPDTLYMVDGGVPRPHPHGPLGFGTAPLHDPPPLLTVVGNEIPVPSLTVMRQLVKRYRELRGSGVARHALALPCSDTGSITRYVQLRVLREAGLPDFSLDLLQNLYRYFPEGAFDEESPRPTFGLPPRRRKIRSMPSAESLLGLDAETSTAPSLPLALPFPPPPPPYCPPPLGCFQPRSSSRGKGFGSVRCPLTNVPKPLPPEDVLPDCASCNSDISRGAQAAEPGLVDLSIPDIARAASSLGRLSLADLELPTVECLGRGTNTKAHQSRMSDGGTRNSGSGATSAQGGGPSCPDLYDFTKVGATIAGPAAYLAVGTPKGSEYNDPAPPDIHCHTTAVGHSRTTRVEFAQQDHIIRSAALVAGSSLAWSRVESSSGCAAAVLPLFSLDARQPDRPELKPRAPDSTDGPTDNRQIPSVHQPDIDTRSPGDGERVVYEPQVTSGRVRRAFKLEVAELQGRFELRTDLQRRTRPGAQETWYGGPSDGHETPIRKSAL